MLNSVMPLVGVDKSISNQLTYGGGTSIGDMSIVFIASQDFGVDITVDAAGWNELHTGTKFWYTDRGLVSKCFWKVLTSGDISTPPVFSGLSQNHILQVISSTGPTSVIDQTYKSDISGTSLAFGGITKPVGTIFIFTYAFSRGNSTFTVPAGSIFSSLNADENISTGVSVMSSSYVNGTDITWTTMPSTFEHGGYLVAAT